MHVAFFLAMRVIFDLVTSFNTILKPKSNDNEPLECGWLHWFIRHDCMERLGAILSLGALSSFRYRIQSRTRQ